MLLKRHVEDASKPAGDASRWVASNCPRTQKSPAYSSLDDAVSGACSQPSERMSGVGGGSRTRLNNFADCYLTVWFHQHDDSSIIHLHAGHVNSASCVALASTCRCECRGGALHPEFCRGASSAPWIAVHLAPTSLRGSSDLPGDFGRAALVTYGARKFPVPPSKVIRGHLDVSPAVHVGFEPTPSA